VLVGGAGRLDLRGCLVGILPLEVLLLVLQELACARASGCKGARPALAGPRAAGRQASRLLRAAAQPQAPHAAELTAE
jgi:hypothetical protein